MVLEVFSNLSDSVILLKLADYDQQIVHTLPKAVNRSLLLSKMLQLEDIKKILRGVWR